jgi:endonuclease YncB( thermonuclease family)
MGCYSSSPTPKVFRINVDLLPRSEYTGNYYYCQLTNIYDGDTADIVFEDNNKFMRFPFRFYGYDSAEMKPLKSDEKRSEKIMQAIEDKSFLQSLVNNQYLVVRFREKEKYGRLMGDVWRVKNISHPPELLSSHSELIDENCINKLMILNNHGKEYYGGKKE